MRRSWIPIVVFGGALALPAIGRAGDEPTASPLKLGSVVPETVEMTDLDGKKVAFKDLRGKVVMIHFWSTVCPWEKHGNEVFKRLDAEYAGSKDAVLIAIASNQGELGAKPEAGADLSGYYGEFRKQIKENGFTHRMFADHGNVLSDLFGAKTTPHCFVIDKKGVLSYAGALDDFSRGKEKETVVYLKDAADALVAGKDVAVKETKPYG
jgi:thiol-disulfide isomerase/thioredoxin